MSRGWRIGIGIAVAVIVLNVALRALSTLTGGTPGGPRSSSFATGKTGLEAYAELLGHAGHPVDRLRRPPHRLALAPDETVVLLDPPAVAARDADALGAFVRSGGRLIAGGNTAWLDAVVPTAPVGSARAERVVRASLPGVGSIETAGGRAFTKPGSMRPLAGTPARIVLASQPVGSGVVFVLSDASPLQNRLLDRRDNAALGLALAGPSGRPVSFLETYHGYGTSSGLAALPLAWKLLLPGLGLAALVYLVARGRRFGPPERRTRDLPPPRQEYVDSLAAVLARTRRPNEAVAPVRARVRGTILSRAALPSDADDDTVRTAAGRLGLPRDEVEAVLQTAQTDADVLAVGRALARIGQDLPG